MNGVDEHWAETIYMHSPTSQIYPLVGLDQALRALRPPRSNLKGSQFSGSDTIAERLLTLMTSSAVRKGSLEEMQFCCCRAELLCTIEKRVRADEPVQLTLMAFPFKVPNPAKVGPRHLPDLAEYAALLRLQQLRYKVKSIYPPGLKIHLIHDGSYIAGVFGITLEEVRLYESYFARLVESLGSERFIHLHDLKALSHADTSRLVRHAAVVREVMPRWLPDAWEMAERTDRFSKTLGMINLRSFSTHEVCRLLDYSQCGRLPSEYRDIERQVHAAMLRYSFRDLLLHALDPRPVCFPDAIHITTQCRPRRLAIWMVSRGRSLLPWHGVGVVDRAGKWRVAQARDVLWDQSYRAVFLDGEDTPFFYCQDA
jgi:hypothetical protein